jgi:hypothetical protein
MKESSNAIPSSTPVDYASPGAYRTSRRYRFISVISLFISLGSLTLFGMLFCATIGSIRDASRHIAANAPGEFWQEYQTQYTSGFYIAIIIALMFLLSVVLLVGAIMLSRANSKAVLLHRVYAGLQILASIGLASVLMWDLYNSPAGMMFYIAAIPGLIASIYPVIVLLALFGVTNRNES